MKQEFEMLQQEMDDIIGINRRKMPVMQIGNVTTGMDLQERINNYWKGLSDKYGFKQMTVEGSSRGKLFFLAEPKPIEVPKTQMEIVDFRTKTFGEIPKQDNPAYYADECILLCKAEEDQTGLYVVLKIDENHKDKDEVSQLGLFWNIEMALLFADIVPSNIKAKPVDCGKPIHKFLKHEFPLT
jgi:hypothetical protein